MKPLPLALIVLASSALAGGVAGTLTRGAAAQETDAGAGASLERLERAVAELSARQTTVERTLAELRVSAKLSPVRDARISVADIDASVARWMERNAAERLETSALAAADEPAAVSRETRVAEALALLDGELSDTEVQRLWREFAEAGLTEDIVAAYEARAEANPNDPDAQVELGGIYLNKIFEVGNSPEAGLWATKADASFDRALEIDERHWEARFSKAISLSFWPPVFGKQGEAIRNFEILVGQQEGLAGGAQYAQTHLLLGNMYQQIGEGEKALSAWRRGLELFPNEEELMGQIEVFGGQ